MNARRSLVLTTIVLLQACSTQSASAPALPPAEPAQSGAAAARASIALPSPPVVLPVHGVATVSFLAQIDPATQLPTFVYQGMKNVIPTIQIDPGDTIVVDVHDLLPPSGGMGSDMNLHFHGLTVSPNPPADNVTTMLAPPGQTLHYIVPVPKNQEPGLYWYHPHVHGQTDYQVGQAGISGAIVINGLESHVPALAKMRQQLLIVRDVDPAAAGVRVARRPHDIDNNTNPCGPDPAGLQATTNGAVAPTIEIAPGESQFFRLINATGHKNLNLSVDGGTLELVAIDGFALDTYPGSAPTMTVTSLVVPPAARAEFVVRGPASGVGALRSLCYDSGPTGDPDPAFIVANLRRPAHASSREAVLAARPLRAGAPLPDNAFSGPLPPIAARRTVVLSEDTNGMYINGKAFSMNAPPMFTVRVGTVEQWQIVNITEEVHDFHIHQTHFYIQAINGTAVAHPHWADSVVVPHRIPIAGGAWRPGYLTVLIDFRDPVIRGEFMFHCHILDHEDSGMMAKIAAI